MFSPKCSQPPCMNIDVSTVDQAGAGGKLGAELRLTEEAGRDHSELENSDLPLALLQGRPRERQGHKLQ